MRWYVEATKVGAHTPPATLVVDAEAWPRALQAARAIRGEAGPIADFTIELLDDGCRAIEPHGLITYRVTTAPDDTPLGEVRAASRVPPRPTPSSPAPSHPGPPNAAPSAPASRPSVPSTVTGTLLDGVPPPADMALDAVSAGWPSSTELKAAAPAPPPPPSKPAVAPAAAPSAPAPAPSAPAAAPSSPAAVAPVAAAAPSAPSIRAPAPPSGPSVPAAPSSASSVSGSSSPALATAASSGSMSAATRAPAAAPSAPAAAPSAPSLPRSSPGVVAAAAATGSDARSSEEELPKAIVIFERLQAPTKDAPLHYREYAFALPPGTSEEVAERALFVELARLQQEMATLPTGKLINLAAFDRIFTGRPTVLPLVTLTWKDWRTEPALDHPARRGTPAAPMPLSFPPPSGAVPAGEPARISSLPSATVPSGPPSAAGEPSSVPRPAPSSGSLHADMTIRIPPHDPPMTDRGDGILAPEDRHLDSLDVPHLPSADAALVHDTLPPGPMPASGSDPFPQSTPAPPSGSGGTEGDSQREPRSFGSIVSSRSSIARVAFPRKRADELLSVLFEAMYDLAFLRDAVEGADFCVGLALEQIPATRGFLHLYDMDRREFVVVAGRGSSAATRLLSRTADQDARFRAVIRQAGATIDGEAVYAPIVQAGRHIGILELDGALDDLPFGEAEGHALVYIARQYAEFVSQRGVVIDAVRVSEMPRSR